MVRCKLECLNPILPGEDLPDGVEVVIGRTSKYRIPDLYCSRQQISLIADYQSKRVTVTVLGRKSPAKIDERKIYAGDKTIANNGSIIEIALGSVRYKIVFYENPKRCSVDIPKLVKKIKPMFQWNEFNNQEVLIGVSSDCHHVTNKIASFDLDGTLITTKSGRTFPISIDDWKLWDPKVKSTIKKLFSDDYSIVIFTNQGSLSTPKGKPLVVQFTKKVENIIEELDVPIRVYISTREGYYRKPAPGMWELMASQVPSDSLDMKLSFYCGDAAGRPDNWKPGKKKDFAMSDRLFAINNKLKFVTPEELFLNERPVPIPSIKFNPGFVCEKAKDFTFVPSETQEVIIMVGSPASGKSHFVKTHVAPAGYKVVSRDELGSWQKCVGIMKAYINSGLSIVIDNTNPDIESRGRYLEICKDKNIKARCFLMAADKDRCLHNNRFRQFSDPTHAVVTTSVIRMFTNKYQPPSIDEGFCDIVVVPFIPYFHSEEDKRKYSLHLIPK